MERSPLLRWLLTGAVMLVLVSIAWFAQSSREIVSHRGDRATATPSATSTPAAPRDGGVPVATPEPLPPITVLPVATELAASLTRKDDPQSALQAVEQLLYFYRQGLGENPVGQNEDIVAALLGENPKRAAYLPADTPAIKGGKLLDPWGTPYWFHPVSRNHMEIRSAGPDRELFTGDDLQGN